jgi:hypothetical protein
VSAGAGSPPRQPQEPALPQGLSPALAAHLAHAQAQQQQQQQQQQLHAQQVCPAPCSPHAG